MLLGRALAKVGKLVWEIGKVGRFIQAFQLRQMHISTDSNISVPQHLHMEE